MVVSSSAGGGGGAGVEATGVWYVKARAEEADGVAKAEDDAERGGGVDAMVPLKCWEGKLGREMGALSGREEGETRVGGSLNFELLVDRKRVSRVDGPTKE
jgi:hypothetical protein